MASGLWGRPVSSSGRPTVAMITMMMKTVIILIADYSTFLTIEGINSYADIVTSIVVYMYIFLASTIYKLDHTLT